MLAFLDMTEVNLAYMSYKIPNGPERNSEKAAWDALAPLSMPGSFRQWIGIGVNRRNEVPCVAPKRALHARSKLLQRIVPIKNQELPE